jgi:hypothetical protein
MFAFEPPAYPGPIPAPLDPSAEMDESMMVIVSTLDSPELEYPVPIPAEESPLASTVEPVIKICETLV